MDNLLDYIYWTLSSIPPKAIIVFLAVLVWMLFVALILCLCAAAKLGEDEDAELEAQSKWLQEQNQSKP